MQLHKFLLYAFLFASAAPIELNAVREEDASPVAISRYGYKKGILDAARKLNESAEYIRKGIACGPIQYTCMTMFYWVLIMYPMTQILSDGANNISKVSQEISSLGVVKLTTEVRGLKQQMTLLVQLLNASLACTKP